MPVMETAPRVEEAIGNFAQQDKKKGGWRRVVTGTASGEGRQTNPCGKLACRWQTGRICGRELPGVSHYVGGESVSSEVEEMAREQDMLLS